MLCATIEDVATAKKATKTAVKGRVRTSTVNRPTPMMLSLGDETIAQLETLAKTWTMSDGSNARSRSDVVRDLIARAHRAQRR